VLEPYSMLSWLAARTRRVQLGVLVTAGSYRHAMVLAKTVSTLDVLSDCRAWLGIGTSWGGDADAAAGIPLPPNSERYDRLEDLLDVCDAAFRGDRGPVAGRHSTVTDLTNSPSPLRRPPVLIAGSGQRRTLPLVARRADACNVLERVGVDEVARTLDVLAWHCADIGRDRGDILATTFGRLGDRDLGRAAARFEALADAGVDLAMVDVPDPTDGSVYDYLGELVRIVAPFGRRLPDRLRELTHPQAAG
jgi:alkanesulfonate monooxygenase SsuD/methylene tetrahydromethanopterin reductase-like flavin-dependent oxidoreductase (luciferase family)